MIQCINHIKGCGNEAVGFLVFMTDDGLTYPCGNEGQCMPVCQHCYDTYYIKQKGRTSKGEGILIIDSFPGSHEKLRQAYKELSKD